MARVSARYRAQSAPVQPEYRHSANSSNGATWKGQCQTYRQCFAGYRRAILSIAGRLVPFLLPGQGCLLHWVVDTSLGQMLVATTEKGICRLSFDEDEKALVARFPKAHILPADATTSAMISGAVAAVENPARMPDLPLDVAGTAFQEAVWQELRRIPIVSVIWAGAPLKAT